MKRVLLVLIVFILVLVDSFAAQRPPTNQKASISVVISTSNAVIPMGALVKIKAVTTNISDHDVTYWRENAEDQGGYVYKITVRDQTGATAPDTEIEKQFKNVENPKDLLISPNLSSATPVNRSGGWFTLKPGESVTDYLSISRLFDMSIPGSYTIQVQRFDQDSKLQVDSNALTITIAL